MPGRRAPDPALDQQMAQHEGLVRWVVRRQWRGSLSFEDALHAGRIGLWHALRGYDPTRGTRFSTYAVPAITRAVWAEVAAASAEPVAAVAFFGDLPAAQVDPAEVLHRAEVRQALDALIARLPDRVRAVVVGHHGLDGARPQTFAQIGQRGGVSRQRVHQLYHRALLLLAHPAVSGPLRSLLDRQQRVDYQQTLARQHQIARAARRGRR